MDPEYDPEKDRSNRAKHGLRLADAVAVFDDPAHQVIDTTRIGDEEQRYKAVGVIEGRCHTVVYTWRGDVRRVISFRPSNRKEVRFHEGS